MPPPPSVRQQQEAYWAQVDKVRSVLDHLRELDGSVRRYAAKLDTLQAEREEAQRRGTSNKNDKSRARYMAKWRDQYEEAEEKYEKGRRRFSAEKQELRSRYQKFQAFRLNNIIGREHGLPQEMRDEISRYL